MRVLMTADSVGGVWSYTVAVAGDLADRGTEVVVAVMGGPLTPGQRAEMQHRNVTLLERPLRLEWMPDAWRDIATAGRWLLELERRYQPDVVHVNGYAVAACRFQAPVVVVAHSCVLSWFAAVRQAAPPPEWRRYEQCVRAGLGNARVVVAPTRSMALSIVYHYAPPSAVLVIRNGVDADRYAPGRKQCYVLTAGRLWDDAKNVQTVAAAAGQVPWPIFAAGAGSATDGLIGLGQLSGTALADWMARAAIYVAPALYEPFGLSVLEAALSGCALVLGDIPSMRELWNGAAEFVDPRDAAALAARIAVLAADDARRTSLQAAARQRGERFSRAEMVDAYAALYQRIAEVPRPAWLTIGGGACAS
jgi:glycogen(starch) synthase